MKIKWSFQAHYLLLLTHFIRAQHEVIIENPKTVYAMLGGNVTLQCCILKQGRIHVTQTQWSKVDGVSSSMIAVHNPTYGTEYLHFAKLGYSHSANFSQQCHHYQNRTFSHSHSTERYAECNQWSLQLNNVSLELAGRYECSFATHPVGIRNSEIRLIIMKPAKLQQPVSATIVKPEISIALHMNVTGMLTLTCTVRKAFPKTNLHWYMDREILKNKSEGMFLKNEDIKDEEGFHEMKSLLTIWDPSQSPIPQIFTCMAVYPFPGNELRNVSSEDIRLPSGFQSTTLASPELTSQVTPGSDSPRERHLHATTNLQKTTITNVSSYSTAPQRLQDSTTVPSKASVHVTRHQILTLPGHISSTKRVTDRISQTIPSSSPTVKDNPSVRKVTEITSLISHGNSLTGKDEFNITGITMNPEPHHSFWPAFVAALLFVCSLLMVLGIRKWCHYQKEIMNRPPSFKPPPPPVKYTSMQECDGAYQTCHQLENL